MSSGCLCASHTPYWTVRMNANETGFRQLKENTVKVPICQSIFLWYITFWKMAQNVSPAVQILTYLNINWYAPLLWFQHASMLECSCHIISYLADVMNALRQSSGQGNSAVLMEGEEKAMEVDSDWVEELVVEEDDSQAEDSVRSCSFILIHRAVFSKYVSVSVCMDLQTYISAVFGLSFYLCQFAIWNNPF